MLLVLEIGGQLSPKDVPTGPRLDTVVHSGAGAVSIDIVNVGWLSLGIFDGHSHAADRSTSLPGEYP